MAKPIEPTVRVSAFQVTAHPNPDHEDAHRVTISVEHTGPGRWAARWYGRCLGKRGQWSWERRNSSRTDRWLSAYRHDLDTALALAKKAAPKLLAEIEADRG
jgi:hypothetical protein